MSKKLTENLRPMGQLNSRNDAPDTRQFSRRTDILISSYGSSPDLLLEKMNLVHDLWGANLSVDISYADELPLANELSFASQEGYMYLIIMKTRADSKIHFKVKSLVSKAETEVARSELVNFLIGELSTSIQSNQYPHQTHGTGSLTRTPRKYEAAGSSSGLDAGSLHGGKDGKLDLHCVEPGSGGGQKRGNKPFRGKDRLVMIDKGKPSWSVWAHVYSPHDSIVFSGKGSWVSCKIAGTRSGPFSIRASQTLISGLVPGRYITG